MATTKFWDKKIKESLQHEAASIQVPDNMFQRIKKEIYESQEKEDMKKRPTINLKKIAIGGLICLVPITCVAAPIITHLSDYNMIGISSNRDGYKEFPTKEQVTKDLGYTTRYVQSFSNGFTFNAGHITQSWLEKKDQPIGSNDKLYETKGISLEYVNPNQKIDEKQYWMTLNAEQVNPELQAAEQQVENPKNVETTEYKGCKIQYSKTDYKFVPEDYKLTDEDNKAIEEGTLEVSVGTAQVEQSKMESCIWYQEGIRYVLNSSNYSLGKEAMIKMAQEVINAK